MTCLTPPNYTYTHTRTLHHSSALNHPRSSPRAIRPLDIIQALADHSRSKQSLLFSSRQHQDAQELFQLISECIKSETAAVDKEGLRDRGLGAALSSPSPASSPSSPASSSQYASSGKYWKEIGKSVFDGLTANRRSCKLCGYTEAVMHFAFDNWQLTVPRAVRFSPFLFYIRYPHDSYCYRRVHVGWKNVLQNTLNSRNSMIAFVGSVPSQSLWIVLRSRRTS